MKQYIYIYFCIVVYSLISSTALALESTTKTINPFEKSEKSNTAWEETQTTEDSFDWNDYIVPCWLEDKPEGRVYCGICVIYNIRDPWQMGYPPNPPFSCL